MEDSDRNLMYDTSRLVSELIIIGEIKAISLYIYRSFGGGLE